jgi:hypothetical protein
MWVIGITSVFALAFEFSWSLVTNLNPDADSIPVDQVAVAGLMRGAATALFLTGLSPWFIRKRPVSRPAASKLAEQPKQEAQ